MRKTLEVNDCDGSSGGIETFKANGQTLTDLEGTNYAYYGLKAQCQGNQFNFLYRDDDEEQWQHLQDSIPVYCKTPEEQNQTLETIVNGLYDSVKWGYMYLQINLADNSVRATYEFAEGSFVGSYDPDTGVVSATWCEKTAAEVTFRGDTYYYDSVDRGSTSVKGDGDGDAERGGAVFEFDYSLEDGFVNQTGAWGYLDEDDTYDDWYLEKIMNPDSDEQDVMDNLKDRFDDEASDIYDDPNCNF